ncbi:MAG: hypothetical protein HGA78_01260 [Nitrospirales bacterium]|nr:hypothetical protein [Nitrospirales bacterium]
MKNRWISEVFEEIADLLEIKGENPFRIRAYRRAAQNIDGLARAVEDMPREDLLKILGISEHLQTGKVTVHKELTDKLPVGLLTLISVPGLGQKTAKILYGRLLKRLKPGQ